MPGTVCANTVRTAVTKSGSLDEAVRDLARQLGTGEAEFTLYFASARQYDPAALAAAMAETFGGNSAGCTTAGEIGPAGYTAGGITAMRFERGPIRVHAYPIDDALSPDPNVIRRHREAFARAAAPGALATDGFCVLLIDGLCLHEEHVVAATYRQFAPMPIVGGSAGDDTMFRATHVFHAGRALAHGAVLLVFETGGVPFRTFRLQDFSPISDYLVITGADPERRIVTELDGEPAAEVYASYFGLPVAGLSFEHFASQSFSVQIGDQQYIRSVRCVQDDGLRLHASIDQGVVVRVARSGETVASLRALAASAPPGPLADALIVFDCMHRRVELTRQGTIAEAGSLLARTPVVGFTTYGEVVDSIHVNQTLTAVALGDGFLTRR